MLSNAQTHIQNANFAQTMRSLEEMKISMDSQLRQMQSLQANQQFSSFYNQMANQNLIPNQNYEPNIEYMSGNRSDGSTVSSPPYNAVHPF